MRENCAGYINQLSKYSPLSCVCVCVCHRRGRVQRKTLPQQRLMPARLGLLHLCVRGRLHRSPVWDGWVSASLSISVWGRIQKPFSVATAGVVVSRGSSQGQNRQLIWLWLIADETGSCLGVEFPNPAQFMNPCIYTRWGFMLIPDTCFLKLDTFKGGSSLMLIQLHI